MPTTYQHHFEVVVEMNDNHTHIGIYLNEELSANWLEGMIYQIDDGIWFETSESEELHEQYESAERILVKGLKMLDTNCRVALKIVGKTDA